MYQTDSSDDTDSSLSINLPFTTAAMSRAQSPVRTQSPSHTTEELLGRMLAQMESLTFSFNTLKRENDNRIDEISKLAKKIGCSGEVETDKETRQPEITNDSSSENEAEDQRIQENSSARFSARFPAPTAPLTTEQETINAKIAVETIRGINGQDDVGVEDFIRTLKRARTRCTQPDLLLDLVIAKKITGFAERAIRYIPINSYEDLFDALRQNLKQSNSILALKSKLESCKQGATETVQNFTLRFRQIINEINYVIQAQHTNPTERRIKIKLEEQEAVNRYLLNLRREVGSQIRLLKPTTITEAQTHAIETEMWLKECQSPRVNPPPKTMQKFISRPTQQPRPNANTTPRAINSNMPLSDRSKMTCHKCGKIGHLAAQCFVKPQGFQSGQHQKRPPQPVRTIQEDEDTDHMEMTNEEIQEQIEYEDSAEYQPYAEDSGPYEQEEEQENIDY